MKSNPVSIGGVWIRSGWDKGTIRTVEVLVEVIEKKLPEWRIIYTGPSSGFGIEGEVSHIVEPLGIEKSPPDPITAPKRKKYGKKKT